MSVAGDTSLANMGKTVLEPFRSSNGGIYNPPIGQEVGAPVVLEGHGGSAFWNVGLTGGAHGEQRLPAGPQLGSGGSEALSDRMPDCHPAIWASGLCVPRPGAFRGFIPDSKVGRYVWAGRGKTLSGSGSTEAPPSPHPGEGFLGRGRKEPEKTLGVSQLCSGLAQGSPRWPRPSLSAQSSQARPSWLPRVCRALASAP